MDVIDFARYFAALAVVLGLLGLLALGTRQGWLASLLSGLGRGGLTGTARERRMKIVESLVLDPRRRVVILRCDAEEHVLLLGPNAETILDRRPLTPDEEAKL